MIKPEKQGRNEKIEGNKGILKSPAGFQFLFIKVSTLSQMFLLKILRRNTVK